MSCCAAAQSTVPTPVVSRLPEVRCTHRFRYCSAAHIPSGAALRLIFLETALAWSRLQSAVTIDDREEGSMVGAVRGF